MASRMGGCWHSAEYAPAGAPPGRAAATAAPVAARFRVAQGVGALRCCVTIKAANVNTMSQGSKPRGKAVAPARMGAHLLASNLRLFKFDSVGSVHVCLHLKLLGGSSESAP